MYKAISFPEEWEYVGNLLSGHEYLDPSIFRHNGLWWLFVYSGKGNLNLYYSKNLVEGWKAHTMNPIIKFNDKIARPAGRIFNYDEKLYRLAQDGNSSYGLQVFVFEITELTENIYKEKPASEKPIVAPTGNGWNAGRMHHIDLHQIGDKWLGAVDGKGR